MIPGSKRVRGSINKLYKNAYKNFYTAFIGYLLKYVESLDIMQKWYSTGRDILLKPPFPIPAE